jgi:F0F1-type ATP synthase membrane subunit a
LNLIIEHDFILILSLAVALILTCNWYLNQLNRTYIPVKIGANMAQDYSTKNNLVIRFIFLVLLNLIGLISFLISINGYPILTLTVSRVFWLLFNLSSFLKLSPVRGIKVVRSFLPSRVSKRLRIGLTALELLRYLLTYLTLIVRLSCNLLVGHILLHLSASISWIVAFSLMITFYLLEIIVSLVQIYILWILLLFFQSNFENKVILRVLKY